MENDTVFFILIIFACLVLYKIAIKTHQQNRRKDTDRRSGIIRRHDYGDPFNGQEQRLISTRRNGKNRREQAPFFGLW